MHPSFRLLAAVVIGAAVLHPMPTLAASADGVVEWAGVSHVAFQDRRPLCPVNGESFQVRFQTWRNDLTAASVHVVANGIPTDVPAAKVGVRGPYDVWAATLPATAATTESYWIALTDGALTDYLSVGGLSHATPVDGGWVLDFTTYAHAPVGATLVNGGAAVFKVWAPTVASAYVRGSFNGWGTTALTKVGEYFIAKVANVADRAEYKFWFPTRATDSGYAPDPRARGLNSGGSYNSYVENPFRFAWTDSAFVTPGFERMVVYQLHVGSFAGLNDPIAGAPNPSRYADVAARVAHLKDLGVNVVQLNPVTEFPSNNSAGYNPITQFSPESYYGTPDQFKSLVNTLHANGIAVTLDIVWNHFSPSDNFLWNYDGTQQWFETPDLQTPWGSQAAFGKAAVADYFANSAQHWLQEYHLDGFRMDATGYMNPGVHSASGWALMQRLNSEKQNRFADKICIAEQLPGNDWITMPVASGGAGFDAQYHMTFRDNVRGAIFAAASGDPSMNNVRTALLGSTWIGGTRALNYVQLHDEAWPSSGGQRLVKTIDSTAPHDDLYARGRTMLAEGLTLTAAGIPAILMGDEWLESNDFNPDGTGRIDWAKKTTYNGVFQFYKKLIGWRTSLGALAASSATHVFHVNEGGNVIAFRRTDGAGNAVVVIANFSNTDYGSYRIGVPAPGNWTELVNSQDPQYGGSGPVNTGSLPASATPYDGFNQSLVLALPKMTFAVLAPLSYVGVDPAPAPAATALALAAPWPNPAHDGATLRFALPHPGDATLAIYDLGGRRVRTLVSGARAAGSHAVHWDGLDDSGAPAPAGLYFVRLAAGREVRSARLVRVP